MSAVRNCRHGVKILRDIQAPLILKLKVPENVPKPWSNWCGAAHECGGKF